MRAVGWSATAAVDDSVGPRSFLNEGFIDPRIVDLATAGATLRIDTENTPIEGIIVSVLQGQIDVWIGEFSGSNLPAVPHFHFFAVGYPVCVPLPRGNYTLTVASAGAVLPVRGTVSLIGR